MAETKEKARIVVKRVNKGGHGGHHGGSWKIAYADFVTAMMAFFLLMWLLSSVEKDKLQGISEYFKTPISGIGKGGPGISEQVRIVDVGGGDKLSTKAGEVQKQDQVTPQKVQTTPSKTDQMQKDDQAEKAALAELKKNVEAALANNPDLAKYSSQIRIDITDEGLKIEVLDEKNRPMFDVGSTQLKSYTLELLKLIGTTLNQVTNKVVLSGHTDATPYAGGGEGFTNWELSSERANAARRALILGGMDEDKILRVVGVSSTNLFNKADPFDPSNRRISILVLDKSKEALLQS